MVSEDCVTGVSQLTHYYNSQKIKGVKASHPVITTKVIRTYGETKIFPEGVVNAGTARLFEPPRSIERGQSSPSCPIYEEKIRSMATS